MRRLFSGTRWVVALLLIGGCATTQAGSHSVRALGSVPQDLPVFAQVDEGFYRGGQPTPAGIRHLAQMGVRTIISLRQPGARGLQEERQLAEQFGMRWVNIPMWCWWRPSHAQVEDFLAVVTDPVSRPVYVHCRQGVHRTGIMVALYRVASQGWTPARAYAEARHHGLIGWNLASRPLLIREAWRVKHSHPSLTVAAIPQP